MAVIRKRPATDQAISSRVFRFGGGRDFKTVCRRCRCCRVPRKCLNREGQITGGMKTFFRILLEAVIDYPLEGRID